MQRKAYPGYISKEQFNNILPMLESMRKRTRPRAIYLYEVFCALLYILKSGCQWRMLPSDFPKWRTVHSYFQILSKKKNNKTSSCLEEV